MVDKEGYFVRCIDCSRKEKREGLSEGEYYCSVATAILSDGIVTDDVDATKCVRERWFRNICQ